MKKEQVKEFFTEVLEKKEEFKSGITMTTRETSIAMTAAVITERYFEQIFKDLCSSYFTTLEKIAELAIEFEDQYQNTNWEGLLLEPLNYNHPEEICSWDDVVMWWTEKRIKELKE